MYWCSPHATAAPQEKDSAEFTESKDSRKGIWQEISEHPEYWKTLIGTGGTWFLYDVSYYGTAIFLPDIQTTIFGQGETLFAMSRPFDPRHPPHLCMCYPLDSPS